MKFLSEFLPFVLIAAASVVRGAGVDMEAYNVALNEAKNLLKDMPSMHLDDICSPQEHFYEIMVSLENLDSAISGDSQNQADYWSLIMTRASKFETVLQGSGFAAATIKKINDVLDNIHEMIAGLFSEQNHNIHDDESDTSSIATTTETRSNVSDTISDKDNVNEVEMQKLYRLLYPIKAARHKIVKHLNAKFQINNTNPGKWKRLAQQMLISIAQEDSKSTYADEISSFTQTEAAYKNEIECFNQVVTLVEGFKLYYDKYSFDAYIDAELRLEKEKLKEFEGRSADIDAESIERANDIFRSDPKEYAPLKEEVMEFYRNFSQRETVTIPIRFIYDLYDMWDNIQRCYSAQANNISAQADLIIVQAIKSETINLIEDFEARIVPRIVEAAQEGHGELAYKALSYAASPAHRVLAILAEDVNSECLKFLPDSHPLTQYPDNSEYRTNLETKLKNFNRVLKQFKTLVPKLEREKATQNDYTEILLEKARETLTRVEEACHWAEESIEISKNMNRRKGVGRYACFITTKQPAPPAEDC